MLMSPNAFAILWPTFALVALIFAVWFWMFVARTGYMRRNPPTGDTFATSESSLRYFEPVEMPANNLRNLFEMPVLFFALVPLLIVTRQVDQIQIILAWAFVILRVAHSLVHVATRKVPVRFLIYALSCAALLAMWIGFAVDIASAQQVIDGAAAGVTAAP